MTVRAAADEAPRNASAELSFEDVYAQHFAEAVRLAYLMTGDYSSAHDLAQDVFVRLVGRMRTIRNPNAVRAYVRRAVTNAVISKARKRRRTTAEMLDAPDPATREDTLGETWQAVLRLSERQRTAVVLRYWLDLSESETARAMRCRPGTVKALAASGLSHLRERLELDGQA